MKDITREGGASSLSPSPNPVHRSVTQGYMTKREFCVHSLISTLNTKSSVKHTLQARLASALHIICPLTPLHLPVTIG